MTRWEYRVVSLPEGQYTQSLNEYGQDGWELVAVVDAPPAAPPPGRKLPMPRVLGQIEDAAAKLTPTQPGTSPLLWVLRRPLPEEEGV